MPQVRVTLLNLLQVCPEVVDLTYNWLLFNIFRLTICFQMLR